MSADQADQIQTTTDRDRAFPGIAALSLTLTQDVDGVLELPEPAQSVTFTKADIPRHAACVNPRCLDGGFDLQMLVVSALSPENADRDIACPGHEGLSDGEAPCPNVGHISIKIVPEEPLG